MQIQLWDVRLMGRWLAAALLVVCAGGAGANAQQPLDMARGACPRLAPSAEYVRSVERALRAKDDVWGEALLRAEGGPTYAAAGRHLAPLLLARGPGREPLTESGFHYVALTHPSGPNGSGSSALHVADGSEIVSHRLDGQRLTIRVGRAGLEGYGSCLARLTPPRLANGYLPILKTRYRDAAGVRYAQESFARRADGETSLTSFVRVDADAQDARGATELRLAPTGGSSLRFEIVPRTSQTVYLGWSSTRTSSRVEEVDRQTYEAAREAMAGYWERRLAEGATIEVPDERVQNAMRNLLVQNLGLTWRYSVGNPYQQFSFPEGLDVAQVMSSYGFSQVAASILRRSLDTPAGPYPNWRIGQKLVAVALDYRLSRDRSLVREMTHSLRRAVGSLERQLDAGGRGLLRRERYSSDIPDLVFGLHSQAVAWQGLNAMGDVWHDVGDRKLAERSRRLALRLESGLRNAVRSSEQRLADGSLFVPVRLLDAETPYDSVTKTRSGSYWNLVAPYALASGFFAPGSHEAEGVLRYLQRHGARLLGLVRAGAYSLYGRRPRSTASGVNPVYGLNVSRFLADAGRADRLVLALYAQLAVGMSPGTFVAGEAASVAPLPGTFFRSMYLPPNGASNASFLETLRMLLVHETRDRTAAPRGLELAYATPRAWLEPGKSIAVRGAPTSFGPISFALNSGAKAVRVSIDLSRLERRPTIGLRLRLPSGRRISRVRLEGREYRQFDPHTATVDLSGSTGRVDLVAVVVHTA